MTKQSALGSNFYVGIYDVSGDIGTVGSIDSMQALQDVSAIDTSGTERIGLRRDGSVSYNSFWNPSSGQAVPVLSAISGQQLITVAKGTARGAFAACLEALKAKFTTVSGQDGTLGATGEAEGSAGVPLEWGYLLTNGKQTYASEPGAQDNGIDRGTGSASNFGAAAYLHAFSLGSGTVQLTVQDSGDRSTWDDVPGLAFTPVTAATTERLVTGPTENVRRYVRVEVTGTFTDLVAAVVVVPYRIAQ